MRRHLASLFLLPLLAACQPAAPKVDTAAEEQAIRAQVTALNAALAAYDTQALSAVYAQDASLLPPNQERLDGPAAIQQFFAGMQQLNVKMVIEPVVVVVAASGDIAMEEGTWSVTMPMPNGSTFSDNGKYLAAWKKIDGTWLMERDIWNSDNAPPSSSAQ
ncbi:MAG: SgcJ/EcaC family oxidoreductase [Gemmatimonadales bacterium]